MKVNYSRDISKKSVPENPTSISFTTDQKTAKTKTFANHFFNFFSSIPILPSLLNFTIKVLTTTSSKSYSLVHYFIPKKESKMDKCAYIFLEDIHLISVELAEISTNIQKAIENAETTSTPMSDFMEQYFSIKRLLSSKFENFETLSERRGPKTDGDYPLTVNIQNFYESIPILDKPFVVKADNDIVQQRNHNKYEQSKSSLQSIIRNLEILQTKNTSKFYKMFNEVKNNEYDRSLENLRKENQSFLNCIIWSLLITSRLTTDEMNEKFLYINRYLHEQSNNIDLSKN